LHYTHHTTDSHPEEEEEEEEEATFAYSAIRNRFTNMFWGPAPRLSPYFTLHDPKVIARFLKERFEHRNTLVAAQTGHNL